MLKISCYVRYRVLSRWRMAEEQLESQEKASFHGVQRAKGESTSWRVGVVAPLPTWDYIITQP
jgi:hypothetical protein